MSAKLIGEYIRKIRKKQGINMENLADENISIATISAVEKGAEWVSESKRRYLCKKLHIPFEDIPTLIIEIANEDNLIMNELIYIEQTIDLGEPQIGVKRLRQLKLSSPYHLATSHYLRGRSYIIQGKDRLKAQSFFEKALQLYHQSIDDPLNIASACYNQIGQILYYDNKYIEALAQTEKGIYAYKKQAKHNQHLIYSLLMNKIVYLNKLEYIDQASKVLNELWSRKNEITYIDVLTNMYDIQAMLHRKNKLYSRALETSYKGLKIAKVNKQLYRVVELLLTIGRTYMDLNKLNEAHTALQTALDIKSQVKQKHAFLPVYTELGKLYLLQRNPDKAREMIERAIDQESIIGDVLRYVEALMTLGESMQWQENHSEALELYQKILDITQKHALLIQEHEIVFRLCEYWKNRDTKEYNLFLEKKFIIELELRKRGMR